jgi:hypothetical protein
MYFNPQNRKIQKYFFNLYFETYNLKIVHYISLLFFKTENVFFFKMFQTSPKYSEKINQSVRKIS